MREDPRVVRFTSFGVGMEISFPSDDLARRSERRISTIFGPKAEPGLSGQMLVRLEVIQERRTSGFLVKDHTGGTEHPFKSEGVVDAVESLARIRVAEFSPRHVFIHAGAVGIGGKALIIPGPSRSGKSTLVKALVECGAVYLSDEYAVLDSEALVHAFPKPVSIRIRDDGSQEDVRIPGTGIDKPPMGCGMVLVTEYLSGADWAPSQLSPGVGILRIMENTVPLRRNTQFSLKVLNKLALRAIIAQSYRPDASKLAISIINYFNRTAISTP